MTNFFKNYNIICFYFRRVLLVITNPPPFFTIIRLCDGGGGICTYPRPIHFRKIDMTTKNSGGFIRFPPLLRGDDAMRLQTGYWRLYSVSDVFQRLCKLAAYFVEHLFFRSANQKNSWFFLCFSDRSIFHKIMLIYERKSDFPKIWKEY